MSNSWELLDTLSKGGSSTYDIDFGFSMDYDDDRLVVGVPKEDDGPRDSGRVFFYEHDGSGGFTLIQKISPPTPSVDMGFGWSVSIKGDVLVIGAPKYDDGVWNNVGAVFIYEYSGGTWNYSTRIDPPTGTITPTSDFEIDQTIYVPEILTNVRYEASIGYNYYTINNIPTASQGIYYSFSESNFGYSVSLDDDTIAIGAPDYLGNSTPGMVRTVVGEYYYYNCGAVFVVRKVNGSWVMCQKPLLPNFQNNPSYMTDYYVFSRTSIDRPTFLKKFRFGSSVSLVKEKGILIGANKYSGSMATRSMDGGRYYGTNYNSSYDNPPLGGAFYAKYDINGLQEYRNGNIINPAPYGYGYSSSDRNDNNLCIALPVYINPIGDITFDNLNDTVGCIYPSNFFPDNTSFNIGHKTLLSYDSSTNKTFGFVSAHTTKIAKNITEGDSINSCQYNPSSCLFNEIGGYYFFTVDSTYQIDYLSPLLLQRGTSSTSINDDEFNSDSLGLNMDLRNNQLIVTSNGVHEGNTSDYCYIYDIDHTTKAITNSSQLIQGNTERISFSRSGDISLVKKDGYIIASSTSIQRDQTYGIANVYTYTEPSSVFPAFVLFVS